MMNIHKLRLVFFLILFSLTFNHVSLIKGTSLSTNPTLHVFAFNKAMLKDNIKLQERGVVAIEKIKASAQKIDSCHINTIIEPAINYRDYLKNPVEMKVSQQIIFNELDSYSQSLTDRDVFIVYSHTHGLKNNFTKQEPWGGLKLDNGSTLPHKGVTIWPDYSSKLLSLPGKTVVVLIMSCYSGGLIDYLQSIKEQWEERSKEGRNFIVITSQNNALLSNPVKVDGEIVNPFTIAVERALNGEADGFLTGKADQKVTTEEFVRFIVETTHLLDNHAFPQTEGSYNPNDLLFLLEAPSN